MPSKRFELRSLGAGVYDVDLVERCLGGVRAAWEDFASRYHDVVVRTVRHTLMRLCRRAPEHDVENIVQDIFSGLLEDSGRRLRTFSGQCSLKGWLRSVATRRAVNYVRDEKRRRGKPLDEKLLFIPESRRSEADEAMAEHIRRLDATLNELSLRDRLVLRLYYLDGIPLKNIAVLLGVSRNTIWPMVTRARNRLQKRLASG